VGKSTLVGHLLRLVGAAGPASGRRSGSHAQRTRSKSRASVADELAWTTDEDRVEQERGITIDIATRIFQSGLSKKIFCLIDSPGHRDFVPAMILGTSQANAAILIVDASVGEFESGFSADGQAREHTLLLRALGVSRLIVVVNKMDMVSFSQTRYAEIEEHVRAFLKSTGWRVGSDVTFIPASGLHGVNLVESPAKDHMLGSWYLGGTLLNALESIPPSNEETISAAMARPTRFVVSDVFRSSSLGGVLAVCGRLLCGTVTVKDRLLVSPSSEIAQVKSIRLGLNTKLQDDRPVIAGADNLPISLGLTDIPDTFLISPGDVLCDPASKVPVVSRFRARILVLESSVPVVQGTQVELHLGGVYEAAWISKLNELVDAKTAAKGLGSGNDSEKRPRPRRLVKGNSAIVEISVSRKICVEPGADVKFLGRFALRCQGRTIAAGVVTVLLEEK
jgi:elongation factor 1 alpha-like protein